jgi:hypothetical protein
MSGKKREKAVCHQHILLIITEDKIEALGETKNMKKWPLKQIHKMRIRWKRKWNQR